MPPARALKMAVVVVYVLVLVSSLVLQIMILSVTQLCTGNFKSVVQKSRRESAHARTFGEIFAHALILVTIFGQRT